jgi:tRNA A37 threonylcarbamoyladenosine synthetase subunit TsaC/SUA5/YrdC
MTKKIFLTSSDTAIGFVSKDAKSLDNAKDRIPNKKYIQAIPDLKSIKKRVPKKHRKLVRRAKKTTFVLDSNYSFRVVRNKRHNLLLKRLGWAYTTSANRSGLEYEYSYAYSKADIIVYPLKNSKPSTILRLGKSKLQRLR